MEKAIEITGMVNAQRQLVLDELLPIVGPAKVRVIILFPKTTEINEKEWYHAADSNPAFDYLREPEENIYLPTDGRPFKNDMSSIEHLTIVELQNFLSSLDLPPDTRLTITFEDRQAAFKALKRQNAIVAMKKLKGSGNGNLVTVILNEREKEATQATL